MLLIKIYNYLKTRKFIFRLPRHVDVLEFDSCNPQLTNRVIGDIMTLYCLNIRENFYINIKIVFLAAFYLKNKGIKGYWLAVFDTIAPKVIITLIEQDLTFSWFNRNYDKSQFLAIGSATCFFTEDKDKIGYPLNIPFYDRNNVPTFKHYACIGYREKDIYEKNGAMIENYYPVGTLLDSFYRMEMDKSKKKEYDICIVSGSIVDHYSNIEVLINLRKLMDEYQYIKVVVAMKKKGDKNSLEEQNKKNIYKKYLGENITIINSDYKYSTYQLLDKSHLGIGLIPLCLTALRESGSRGNKIIFCNYTRVGGMEEPYLVDDLLISSGDYYEFKCKIMKQLNCTSNEYFDNYKNIISWYNGYSIDNPSHLAVRSIVGDLISVEDYRTKLLEDN